MVLYRQIKLNPHAESLGADSRKTQTPFDFAQADRSRPWALILISALRSAVGPVGFKSDHNGRAIDEGFSTLKTGTGLAVVEHSGIVLVRFVEIRPLNRRTARKPRVASLFRRTQLHGSPPFMNGF